MKTLIGLLIATTLALGSGCAKQDWIDRTLVTVDVTGTWQEISGYAGGMSYRFELAQQGPVVKGHVQLQGAPGMGENPTGPLEGTVSGDVFHVSKRGLEMEVTVNGDEMNGQIWTMFGRRRVYLRRIDPSSPPGIAAPVSGRPAQ